MDATIRSIYRYPVKGLSAEKLDRVGLAAGQCLPHDRPFAIALDSTEFDPAHPEWLSKTHFIMLMRDAALARLSTHFDPQHGELSIAEDGKTLLRASLCEAEGCCRIARFFDEFMDGAVAGPLRIVEAPGHAFADARPKPNASTDKYVSLINLASIRDLEGKIGASVDPLRFSGQCLFRRAAGLGRAGFNGTRNPRRRGPAQGYRTDHPLRRDRSQPGNRRARHSHGRRAHASFRAQSDGHLRRGARPRRYRDRRPPRGVTRDRATLRRRP
jgi:hypothetical protein